MIQNLTDRFYHNDDKNILKFLLEKIILNGPTKDCIFKTRKDKWDELLERKTLFKSGCKGIPIGNLTSQIFSNFYLNKVDRLYNNHKDCKYMRYVDDIVVLSKNRRSLESYKNNIIKELKKINCKIS